ncbi:hypothetical protein M758_UG208200 [Ceratodon purpureus]|nr:hypothetical protein M758_UG208200 [Ceratodon purpureus]
MVFFITFKLQTLLLCKFHSSSIFNPCYGFFQKKVKRNVKDWKVRFKNFPM